MKSFAILNNDLEDSLPHILVTFVKYIPHYQKVPLIISVKWLLCLYTVVRYLGLFYVTYN